MIAVYILFIVLFLMLILCFWAVDLRLDAIRADLDRLENMLLAIADAVGVEDEMGEYLELEPFYEDF